MSEKQHLPCPDVQGCGSSDAWGYNTETNLGYCFAYFQDRLVYNKDTGKFFWKPRPREMFATQNAFGTWNTNFAGKEAFTSFSNGYKLSRIMKVNFLAHRVAWLMTYGGWPKNQIDHINGDRSDNRITNLRDVSVLTQRRNMRMNSRNTSGYTGVMWDKAAAKWRAVIYIEGVQKHLGMFENIEDAISVRKEAEVAYGFTERHGK